VIGVKKAWKQALAMVLATGMALSLFSPGAMAAEDPDPSGGQTIYEYIEVTEADGLESGQVYAIVAPNNQHSILFHSHASDGKSDQVIGTVVDNKLFLNDTNPNFTMDTQTWTITAKDGGYTVSSKADGHFLNFHTTSASKVPVNESEQVLTISPNPDGAGWSISAETDGVTYYLHHDATGQFAVNTLTEDAEPTYFGIYKQAVTTLYVPEIPGYELATSNSDLDESKYYMFVGKGADGKMYALLPGDGTNPTDTPQPRLTAELTVSDGTITAKRVWDGQDMPIGELLFRSFRYSGGSDTFASAKKSGRLLSLREFMFTDVAGSITVAVGPYGRVTLRSGSGKYLSLNIQGDAASVFSKQATGFYGPTSAEGCPIYLLSSKNATVPDIDLTIPGYTRITSPTQLEIGSEYMMVSADSYGDLYALYPDPDGVGMLPGDAIDPTKAGHTSYASVTAQLTVDKDAKTVTAQHLKTDGSSEATDMKKLHFTVERTGNTFSVQYGENLYLAMVDDHFFTTTPTELSITPDTSNPVSIYPEDGKFLVKDLHSGRNNARILDFNVKGGPIQFVSGPDENGDIHTFNTNFWGPRGKRYPIYIYEHVGEFIPLTPERNRLKTVVDEVSLRHPDDYTPRSWEDFDAALQAAQALLEPERNPSEDECTAALAALRGAGDLLVLKSAVIDPEAPSGTTQKQPFIAETVDGSENFRGPGLVTLSGGALAAAADARWDHADPAKGVDTAFSFSNDGGKTWTYTFPNFFADSANEQNAKSAYAAAFTNPVLAAAGEDTVHLLTNLFPGGTALQSAPKTPDAATGFGEIGGAQRLLVYKNNIDQTQTDSSYDYYVGDFDEGYADLYDAASNKTLYYVDRSYNLYRRAKDAEEKVPADDQLHCRQWDGDDPYGASYVQQNLFFYHSDLHVRNASYLWLRTGTYDGGAFTWSEPTLLNPQVRTDGDSKFFGTAPGRGTVTESGAIVLPAYSSDGASSEHPGVITSTDGVNWTRGAALSDSSSDAAPVAVGDALYLFTGGGCCTSDDNGATWSAAKATGADYNADGQLSAIHLTEKIGDQDAILLSAPSDSHANGKLFLFLVEEDGDLTLQREYPVTEGYFGGSCLAQLPSGDVGLLYESAAHASGTDAAITYTTAALADILKSGAAEERVALKTGEAKTFDLDAGGQILYHSDDAVVTAEVASADGQTTLTLTGKSAGTADIVVGDTLYRVTVTAPSTGGNDSSGHRPSHTQKPADPVADCPQDDTCPLAGYADTDPKAWYHDGAHYCVDTGLMAGYGNGHWGPGDTLTRGMLVQILYNKAGRPAVTGEAPFTDVEPAAWYAGAVAWAAAEGIVEGYGDGTFAPEMPVTRQDAVTILHRYTGSPAAKETALDAFSDREAVGSWAVEALGWAVEQGLILGKGDATLAPQHHATRAETAALLHRHFG